jgi:hypothetical protein
MNKYTLVICFSCLLTLLGCNNAEELWEKKDIGISERNNPFNVDELQFTENGNIYAFGHFIDETINCGLFGIMNCQPLIIYRSANNGNDWEQITTPKISEKHSTYETDKIPIDLLPIKKSWKNAKKIASAIGSNDSGKSYRAFQQQDRNVFLYVDGDLYEVSLDKQWLELKTNGRFGSAYPDDPLYLSNEEIYMRQTLNCYESYFKKTNEIYNDDKAGYTVVIDESMQTKLIPVLNLNNKSLDDEYDANNRFLKRYCNYIIYEIFESKNGKFFSAIELEEDKGGSIEGLYFNTKLDQNFKKINLFKSEELNNRCTKIRIKSVMNDFLLLKVNLSIPNTSTALTSNMSLRYYFIFDSKENKLYKIQLPTNEELSVNENLRFKINPIDGTLIATKLDGMYQSKSPITELIDKVLIEINEDDYQLE